MSAFKLLEDYCAKHALPAPKSRVGYGNYGGRIGFIEIGDKSYRDYHERNKSDEALDAVALIALRDVLDL